MPNSSKTSFLDIKLMSIIPKFERKKCGSDCKIFALDNCRLNRIHQGGTSSQAASLVQLLSMLITLYGVLSQILFDLSH